MSQIVSYKRVMESVSCKVYFRGSESWPKVKFVRYTSGEVGRVPSVSSKVYFRGSES